MFKKLSLLALPLLLAGCAGTFTNLTPTRQPRSTDNLYPVEVQFNSRQQTLKWHSIKPYIMVGDSLIPMKQTKLLNNRWEGYVPVGAAENSVAYRYKFEYEINSFGPPEPGSALSPAYELKVLDAR
jgi:hypothetical protein